MIKKAYNNHKETIHNFIWRSIQIFGKQGIIFLIFILCARMLIPYDFGIYNYTLAIIFFLIIFGDFGISTATSKYVAEYNVTDKEKLKSVLFNSGIVILGLTIIITLLTLLIGPYYLKDKYIYVLYLIPLIFLAPMTSLYDGIYRGLKRFKQLAIISTLVGLFSLSFVYILIKNYGLIGALISQDIFYLILLISLGLGYREFNFKLDKSVLKEIGKYSVIIGITSISYFFYTKIDLIILGHFGYIKEIGYYEMLNKIFEIIIIPTIIFGQIIAPNITRLYVLKEYNKVKNKFIYQIILSIMISIPLTIFLYFITPLLIKIVIPTQFTAETLIMFYLLIWILPIRFLAGIIGHGFTNSTGNAHYSMITLLIAGFLNLILDIYFIYNFGFIGVVYSTVICYTFAILSFIILFFFKIRRLSKNEK